MKLQELFKLFTTQFRFIKDNEEFERKVINEINIDNNSIISTTKFTKITN